MRNRFPLAVLLLCSVTATSWAHGPQDRPSPPSPGWHNTGEWNNHGEGPRQGDDYRGSWGEHDARHDNHFRDHREQDHFAWNGNQFHRGQPAPEQFRGEHYRINDWRGRGLPAPPIGQYWSAVNGNYMLIAAATGIITSILINSAMNH